MQTVITGKDRHGVNPDPNASPVPLSPLESTSDQQLTGAHAPFVEAACQESHRKGTRK
jgi:hypothetical protein